MSGNRTSPKYLTGTDSGSAPRIGGSFNFQSLNSAPPIRFNPDTPEPVWPSSQESRSSLSPSLSPDTLRATAAFTEDERTKQNHDAKQSSSMTINQATSSVVREPLPTPSPKWHAYSGVPSPSPPPVSAPYQASSDGPKGLGKLTTQYVMPDGSVITGKGLGRGRPGVKRGPRKSNVPGEDTIESVPSGSTPVPSAVDGIGSKRKRTDSDIAQTKQRRDRSWTSSMPSRESSVEEIPNITQTRFGRQTQKPVPLVIPVTTPTATASPASKKPSVPTPTFKSHPKIKRKVYRGKEQLALCEHCLRGFGPPGNVIVFCDACNKCWHQLCHQPQIPKATVDDAKAEWFCASCDKILHGNKKSKKILLKIEAKSLPPPPPEQKFGPPLVGAIALTLEQRVKYLETLPREKLIGLLLRAGELAPQMPIFETPVLPPVIVPLSQPQFTSSYVTPVTTDPDFIKASSNDVPDEGYDDTYDEHAALYPKVGEGVKLPPERLDLHMLLEGQESRTFSHWVKGQPVKTVVDTVPLHQSQFTKSNK